MKNSLVIFTSFLLFLVILQSTLHYNLPVFCTKSSEAPKHVGDTPTIWFSPDGKTPQGFRDSEQPYKLSYTDNIQIESSSLKTKIFLIVTTLIYNTIQSSLLQYTIDLTESGYTVSVYPGSWGTPAAVRTFLQQGWQNGLEGCLLIGDIPSAWYEMDNPSPWGHEEFPIDLYYMDLDGIWNDTDGDSIFDEHNGNVEPEIWVGRLKTSNLDGQETALMENYFTKNHHYRSGLLTLPRKALVYVDDDWYPEADEDYNALKQVYTDVTLVKDMLTTNASDYKERLTQGYEWIHLRCHGSSSSHTFKIPNGQWDGTVYSHDYRSICPDAFFYQLFVCSAARFTENNYLAGSCVFTDTNGLLAIGSTKTGSMSNFTDFYSVLSSNSTIGDAFKDWFINYGESDRKWFYGLTIIGDPLLKPLQSPRPAHDVAVLSLTTSKTTVGQNYSTTVNVTVENQGEYAESFNLTVYANFSEIHQTTINLTGKDQTEISFEWSTVEFLKGNYTISAVADTVVGETDTSDNILDAEKDVCVTIPGDVDADYDVDIFDIVAIAGAYGSDEGDPAYNPNYDIDGDGDIDIFDIVAAAGHYGESW